MIETIRRISSALDRWYDRTRLRTWSADPALRVEVFGSSLDSDHIALCLDAIETFHPGSEVTVWTEAPESEAIASIVGRYPELASCVHRSANPDEHAQEDSAIDRAILLHPWPYPDAEKMAALRRPKKAFLRRPAKRKWILFRNLELWDGTNKSRWKRRLQNLVRRPLRDVVERADRSVLASRGVRFGGGDSRWSGVDPCRHPRAHRLFKYPREIRFCPDCGMGVTLLGEAPKIDVAAPLSGPGSSFGFRYTGRRELARSFEECFARVESYLRVLGFDFHSPGTEPHRVLDYGCGTGRYARLWVERGWDYLGVDPSEENIERAREWHERRPEGKNEEGPRMAEFVRGRLDAAGGELFHERMDAAGPFGAIFLSHVLEHLPDPSDALSRLRRRSAPGGWLYVEAPNADTYTWSMAHHGYRTIDHLFDFTPEMLRVLIEAAGWKDVRVHVDPDSVLSPYLAMTARNTA